MLEKPAIPEELLISCLEKEYDLHVADLTFLPIGADLRTAVYRVVSNNGNRYFLKLRRNFQEVIVRVPLFLRDQGIQEILVPFETLSRQYWADFGEYKLILYPFIEGKDGFERELTDQQRQVLGAAFSKIHTAEVPSNLKQLIRKEAFSPEWRDDMKSFLVQVESKTFQDPTAIELTEFIKSKRNVINLLIDQAEQLCILLQSQPQNLVLCHSDIHGGNILISNSGELYIVDWDDPILAPRERDLMFIGGGIDQIWETEGAQAAFYKGYGQTKIDLEALAYYRYERVIEDLVVICMQILSTDEGGEDRKQGYRWFTSNFEPGQTIEIADRTYRRMVENKASG